MSKKFTPTEDDSWIYGQEIPGDWHKYKGMCPNCGSRTFDYGGGWRCMALYCSNNVGNLAPNLGPEPGWWFDDTIVSKIGDNAWIAHGPLPGVDLDLYKDQIGTGCNPKEAVKMLKHKLKIQKMSALN